MRKITEIIIHCSATQEGKDFSAKHIRRWHVNGNGWSDIGYHYVVRLSGIIDLGRAEETIGAHSKGHNRNSIGICYVGGLDIKGNPKDTRTEQQDVALVNLLQALKEKYPEANVIGHNEVSGKACPSFDVQESYGWLNDGQATE